MSLKKYRMHTPALPPKTLDFCLDSHYEKVLEHLPRLSKQLSFLPTEMTPGVPLSPK